MNPMVTNPDGQEARTPRRSRADVTGAALAILDAQGLPDLTMRNLAARLGLQPSALYWHFPNKQALLAAVADEIVSRARPAVSDAQGDWRDAVRSEAVALHDALLAFKDGAEVVSSTLALGLGAEEASARLAAAIRLGGVDGMLADRSAEALLHFVIGQSWHEQQRLQADSLGVVAPSVASHPDALVGDRDASGVFEVGLDLFVAGLEAGRLSEI
jgi:TetR/AcrR family tetracycline transcriptional repressor